MNTQITEDEQFEQLMGLLTEYYENINSINQILKRTVNPPKPSFKMLKNKQLRLEKKISDLKEKREKLNSSIEDFEREKLNVEFQITQFEKSNSKIKNL